MPTLPRSFALFVGSLWVCAQALASEAGWRQLTLPAADAQTAPTVVALYYPTQAPALTAAMGPFAPRVAIQALPEPAFKGLILLSHGTGGSELGHTSLAEALARHGYLVAALRHPGDNWQDRSLLQRSPQHYFSERPKQVSRVLDALLRDPEWKDRIACDAQGQRIGALGHSAGGYTVLALASGQPDLARIAQHCQAERAEDPIFCGMGAPAPAGGVAAPTPPAVPVLRDARVRAVVAMAPLGAVFTAASLAAIQVPTRVYEAEQDRFLVPRFHAEWIAANAPAAELRRIAGAGHFAFMDRPGMPIGSPDGDIGADPLGFDRPALLQRLTQELPAFFDQAWR